MIDDGKMMLVYNYVSLLLAKIIKKKDKKKKGIENYSKGINKLHKAVIVNLG